MGKFSVWIKRLEKRKVISKKPRPAIPFILSFIILAWGIITSYISNIDKIWSCAFFFLAGFSFIFAILHWMVVRICDR